VNRVVIGIFVGGAGSRMGGVAKGLLGAPASSETLLERLRRVCGEALPAAELCLVGRASAYTAFGLPALADDPVDVGPIGGLRALLRRAQSGGAERALALACDLPFIDAAALRTIGAPLRLSARAPFVDGRFHPLAAAYAPAPALAAVDRALGRGKHALMSVLDELGPQIERVEADAISGAVLRDWDEPADLTR
jgi:molybdopterin-guanine dinucleotide biosynthesis protein A